MLPRLLPALTTAGSASLLLLALVVDLVLWGGDPHLRFGGSLPQVGLVAADFAAFALLWLRGRHPYGCFAGVWLFSVIAALLVPTYQPFAALFLALHRIARTSSLRPAVTALLLSGVLVGVDVANAVHNLRNGPVTVVVTAALWLVLLAMVWVSGRLRCRADQTWRLREAKLRAEAELDRQSDRLRLARELHDSVAHAVTAMVFQAAGAAARATSDVSGQQTFRRIEAAGVDALRELRRLLGLLHAGPGLEDEEWSVGASLADADQLYATARSCGLELEVAEHGKARPLAADVDHAVFRVLQESLSNAVKHGGSSPRAQVTLDRTLPDLTVVVRCRPSALVGPEPVSELSSGLGLKGLADRLHDLGGRLTAGWLGDDFVVQAEVPGGDVGRPRSSPTPVSPRARPVLARSVPAVPR